MEKLTPLADRILLRRIKEDDKYHGLIHLPDQAKEKAQVAEVISTGPGRYEGGELVPCSVKPGDKVMFGKYSGTDLKLGDTEYIVMREEDILGILCPF